MLQRSPSKLPFAGRWRRDRLDSQQSLAAECVVGSQVEQAVIRLPSMHVMQISLALIARVPEANSQTHAARAGLSFDGVSDAATTLDGPLWRKDSGCRRRASPATVSPAVKGLTLQRREVPCMLERDYFGSVISRVSRPCGSGWAND